MACLRPVQMFASGFTKSGKVRYSLSPSRDPVVASHQRSILVPCNKCPACLKKRRKEWISRLMLERFGHEKSCFITLTYSPSHYDGLFHVEHIQKFLKRVRNLPRDYGISLNNFRYFVIGELGSRTRRVHYHAIFFGLNLLDYNLDIVGSSGLRPIYSSRVLSDLWPYGFNTVGECNLSTVKYVTKYAVKGLAYPDSSDFLCLHSQGLGRSLFVNVRRVGRKFHYSKTSLFDNHYLSQSIILPTGDSYDFRRFNLPRSMDNYAERLDLSLFSMVKENRLKYALNRPIPTFNVSSQSRSMVNSFRDIFSSEIF